MLGTIFLLSTTAFAPITYEYRGATINLVSETQCQIVYQDKMCSFDYQIKGNELLLNNEGKGLYFYFEINSDLSLSLIDYDDFVDIKYYHGENVFILETEYICTIIEGDTKTTATYVNTGDKLIITTIKDTYKFNILEGNELELVKQFNLEEWLKEFFSPQQVAMIMTWVGYLATIIGLIINVVKLRKQNNLTAENVKELIMKEMGDKVSEEIKKQTAESLDHIATICENQKEVLSTLTRVFALAQENTPESRVAVLELIAKLGVVEEKSIDNSIKKIETQKEEIIKQKETTKKQVKKVKEETDGASI